MRLEDFPNIYTGEKNCFDCKHFKIKLKVKPIQIPGWLVSLTTEILFQERNYARCTKGFILREGKDRREAAPPKEPIYPICRSKWTNIKKGWRHADWGVANVCEDFESMVDEQEILIEKLIRAGKILDAMPCLSTMFYNPETEEIIEIKEE